MVEIAKLASAIKTRRGDLGLREAAKLVGTSHSTLGRTESCKMPSLDVFEKICVWLERDPRDFLSCPAPEPAAGTVRVRIPVYLGEFGALVVDFIQFTRVTSGPKFEDYGKRYPDGRLVAYITADIPLPQPVEIPGAVEIENGVG